MTQSLSIKRPSLISRQLLDLIKEIASTKVDFVELERPVPFTNKSNLTLNDPDVVETKKIAVETRCAMLGAEALSSLQTMAQICHEAATFIEKNMWRPIDQLSGIEIPDGFRILGKTEKGFVHIYYWDAQKYHKNPSVFWRQASLGSTWSRQNPPVYFKTLDDDEPSEALKALVVWG